MKQGPGEQAAFFNELQRIALERTRLKIPLLQTEEGTHGLMCSGGTIFPEGLGLGSTWNMPLLEQAYAVAAAEARALGIHQLFTLVVEPNRDPRLGRNEEGYSEDPFLCAEIARAVVRGVQGTNVNARDKAVAGLCHYPGQSQPTSGLERGAMEISERALREVFLPPWVAGIRDLGALGVMATYPAIDGTPVHASEFILTELLRRELKFEGLVLGEGGGLSTLLYEGLAPGPMEAGELAIRAGLDVGISYESAYMNDLMRSVESGRTPMWLVDRAVRRILRQKLRLGLFEHPYVDEAAGVAISHRPAHVELARRVAHEGIVLLRNENGTLPLRKDLRAIAVIGPNADDAKNQLGDYTSIAVLQPIVTVLNGVQEAVSSNTRVQHVKGCDVIGDDTDQIAEAVAAARGADAAIVVLGENEWRAPRKRGTNGEGYDAATLELTGNQEALLRAVVATGTPTVLVLINGRPLAIRWAADHVPAIVEAWRCGEQGGRAVADVLFGDVNPSGRLPITVPRHAGQLPVYYNAKPSKDYWLTHGWGKPYVDLDPRPLYSFGHGLSYTRFEYRDLQIAPASAAIGEPIQVTCRVHNTGDRAGAEVVQLYLRDRIGSVTTPAKQLRGFAKIVLNPGEQQTVRFTVTSDHLALLDRNLRWVVEPGEFEVMIGASAQDTRLAGRFAITPRPARTTARR